MKISEADILAVGAHPDDIEAGAGGLLLKSKKLGKKTAVLILTRGEAGGAGTADIRSEEAKAAAKVLGADYFQMLSFPDSKLECSLESAEVIGDIIRTLKPKIVVCPWHEDYHPDHVAAYKLTEKGIFLAARRAEGKQRHFVSQFFGYNINMKGIAYPDFIIDISDVYEEKQNAMKAHASQQSVLNNFAMLAGYYGNLGGYRFGEGFKSQDPIKINDITALFSGDDGGL